MPGALLHAVRLAPRHDPRLGLGSSELKANSLGSHAATQVQPGQLGRLERSIIDLALRLGALGLRRLRPGPVSPMILVRLHN